MKNEPPKQPEQPGKPDGPTSPFIAWLVSWWPFLAIGLGVVLVGVFSLRSTDQTAIETVFETVTETSLFAVDLNPPVTNPVDPYVPEPLRVGTVGAAIYHRPWCSAAKRALILHGKEKRINFWTREQVANSGRNPDNNICMSSVFDCPDDPIGFAATDNDPWCGANLRRTAYIVEGIDAELLGKELCSLQGLVGIFVDDPDHCLANGVILGSSAFCDTGICQACRTAGTGVDCTAACNGCVNITMALINNITLGLGDGNKDGETNRDDYLHFAECFSGANSVASLPCQNVFDWDEDTDVDVQDFSLFAEVQDSGNVTWANVNFPDASVNEAVIELPLRVGTDGSDLYHRLDCPAVNASWEKWGLDRRKDFYSWDEIEGTGRVPDTAVCFSGTRQNPSGSWDRCDIDDDLDGTMNCNDGCPEDTTKTTPGMCGCGRSETECIAVLGFTSYWRLDETVGTDVQDVMGTNFGTYTGGVTLAQPGQMLRAPVFDGVDDHIVFPHNVSMLRDEGTVSFWFKTPTPLRNSGLFSKDATGNGTGGHLNIITNAQKVHVRLQSTTASISIESVTSIQANTWHHVAVTWGADGLKLFLDGFQEAIDPFVGGLDGNQEPLVLGADTGTSTLGSHLPLINHFNGQLDDVRFYPFALSLEQVNELVSSIFPGQ